MTKGLTTRSVRRFADDYCSTSRLRVETEFDIHARNQVGLAICGTGEVDTTARRVRNGQYAYELPVLEPILVRIVSFLTFASSSPVAIPHQTWSILGRASHGYALVSQSCRARIISNPHGKQVRIGLVSHPSKTDSRRITSIDSSCHWRARCI